MLVDVGRQMRVPFGGQQNGEVAFDWQEDIWGVWVRDVQFDIFGMGVGGYWNGNGSEVGMGFACR